MQLLCVFCLVVFTRESRQVGTDSLERSATSDNINDGQKQSPGSSETIKTIQFVNVKRGPSRHKHENTRTLDKSSQTVSFLRQLHDKRDFKVNHRRRKRESVNKTRNEQDRTRVIQSSEDKLQTFPKPAAQVQPTNFPDDPTTFPEWDISPGEDFEEPYTPLGPFDPRSRTPGVKNPFYPVTGDSYGAYAVVGISVIIFTVGIIGNIAIMCIVCHNYYMRSISNSLLANLALWDFVNLFFCLPLVIFHELTKDWLLGEFSCKIIPYIEVNPIGCVQVDA